MRAEHTPITNPPPDDHSAAAADNRNTHSLKDLLCAVLETDDSKLMILGIGNSLKGDDGAGPKLCELLKGKISADVVDAGSVPENYVGKIVKKSPKTLLIVDAVDLGEAVGTVKLLRPEQLQQYAFSTHCLSPHLFAQLLQSQIDVQIFFLAIQPMHLALNQPLSELVSGVIASIANQIEQALGVDH